MQLRQYQEKLISGLSNSLARTRKVCGQLATGGGKTVVFAGIAHRYISKSKKRVLILVHRKELLQQTRRTAHNAFKLNCQPIKAGMRYIPDADIYVGMVESVARRIDKLPKDIGLVIIDEAHIASFNKMHEYFPDQLIIGFTATPLSSSKKFPMKNFYDDIVCGVDIPELIKDGHLCQNITWAPKDTVDRMELAIKNGEFDDSLMGQAFSKSKYIRNTVSAYERWGAGNKTIIFNVNVSHSEEVCKAFVESGYNCKHVDGSTPQAERDEILQWFSNTPDAILCNVGIATTGFDEPTIETVIINKATMSMPLWLQMCGRGSRPTPAKSAFTIIDMGGNAIAHGDWCYPRDWRSIFEEPPKPGKETAAPCKSCPECAAIIPAGSKVCAYCGYEYPSGAISVEIDLHEFVMVTRGINVQAVIEENKHKKEYYSFFKIGRDLALQAQATIPQMNDEYAQYILTKYFDLGREWTAKHGRKFNKWHQTKATEILFSELKQLFKKWDTELISVFTHEVPEERPVSVIEPLTTLQPLQNL